MRSLSLLRTGTRAFTKRPLSNLSSRCSQYLPATSSILSNQFNRTSSPSLLSFVPRANIQSVSPSAPVSHPDAPARVAIEAEVRSGKKKYYAARLREVGVSTTLQILGPCGLAELARAGAFACLSLRLCRSVPSFCSSAHHGS